MFKLIIPEEIQDLIYDYLPTRVKLTLTKETYSEYHRRHFDPRNYSYIRDMLRKDSNYVISQLLNENGSEWLGRRKYKYNNKMYKNYIDFLDDFCIQNNSTKCRQLLQMCMSQNQYKKTSIQI
jgi:hypothetical protein